MLCESRYNLIHLQEYWAQDLYEKVRAGETDMLVINQPVIIYTVYPFKQLSTTKLPIGDGVFKLAGCNICHCKVDLTVNALRR